MKLILTLGPGFDPATYGDVVVFDWASKRVVDELRYTHRVYQRTHKGLAGASWHGARLLVSTEAELLALDVAPLRLARAETFPFLNDVHHLAARGDRIWVCNTGLDCLEELDADWTLQASHDLIARFGRAGRDVAVLLRDDVRKSWNRLRGHYEFYGHLTRRPPFRNLVKLVAPGAYRHNGHDLRYSDFRPHVLHPNHVLPVDGDLWITLWRTGRLVSFRTGAVLASGLGRPHDGIASGDRFYLTDCDANRLLVYRFDAAPPRLGERLAAKVVTSRIAEGFLRGVAAIGDLVFIGLTARRGAPDPFRRARIVALERRTLEPCGEWVIPDRYGSNVFSVVDAGPAYG